MKFRCKRYRVVEMQDKQKMLGKWKAGEWGVPADPVFCVVERRWWGCLWLPQPIPHIYFGFPFGLSSGQFVFYSFEDAADALCGWLRATHRPDDYRVYIHLPTF